MEVGTVTAIIAALLSVIALLLIVIRWVMDSKKPTNGNGNGNGAKQSRDCWEQHQNLISKIDQVQKTLDDRQELFAKVERKLDEINLSVHSK